jgi:hypothetical protein
MQEKLVHGCTYLKIYDFKIEVIIYRQSPKMMRSKQYLWSLFLYSYESEFLQKLVKGKKIQEARAFNFTYRYIDDVLSINNSRFAEFPVLNFVRKICGILA